MNDFKFPDERDRLVRPGHRAERTVQTGIGPVDRVITQIRHSSPNRISRIYGVFTSVGEALSSESLFNMNSTSARCFLM
jgi:hypothetical protein